MVYSIKVLFFEGNAIKEFNSNESEGDILINVQNDEYETYGSNIIRIYKKDDKWFVISDDKIKFYKDDNEMQTCEINPGVLLKLKIKGIEKSMYMMGIIFDASYINFKRFFLPEDKEINIGSDKQNDIVYMQSGVSKLHAKLCFNSDGNIVFTCIKEGRTHLNGSSVKAGVVTLTFGDEINIMGLKIIIFNDFFIINNPENRMICNCIPADAKYLMEDIMHDDYKSIPYTKSPRLIKHLIKDDVDIELPSEPIRQKNQSLIFMMGPSITMAFAMIASLGASIYLSSSGGSLVSIATSGIMTISMLIGAVMWPMLNNRYQKKLSKEEEKQRVVQYTDYINKWKSKLTEKTEWNRNIMLDIHPEPQRIIKRIVNGSRKIWDRNFSDEDFLDIRIGLGNQKNPITINVPQERLSMVNDPLKEEAYKLQKTFSYINEMPITVPFTEDVVVGIIGKWRERINIVCCMLIQLAGLHSYDELKIVFICNETQKRQFEWIKKIPHNWSPDRSVRLFAANREETHEVLNYIDETAREREERNKEGNNNKMLPYYAVFIMDTSLVEEETSMHYLGNPWNEVSICSIFVGESITMLPTHCQTIIQYDDETCSIFSKKRKEEGQLTFNADFIEQKDIMNFSDKISMYKLKSIGGDQSIPTSVDFLGMFRVGTVTQLDLKKRWRDNLPYKSLAAPIGIKAGGSLYSLNIHEKYHGPHGLVAGMTGSGKSEFLQTYILSMAINYHPQDVSFILIDYKGGGMAKCFEELPHVSGIITNLSGNQIRRSLICIDAELKRRQKLFDATGVKHIDEYQILYRENKTDIPLPHLIIISDEFAELKNQQPEFMEKLVSAARIGRSLGVHLILATQKPSGVVDDQIWSNTRFRVCLKVFDRQDSQEMLKRPEAASITLPGRCYMQVGYNEIFECVQSGYSGLKYTPENEYIDPDSQKVTMIDDCARSLKTLSTKKNLQDVEKTTQLDAVVEYIKNYSAENSISQLKIWKEPLKEVISLNDIDGFKDGGFNGLCWERRDEWIMPVVGIVDDPENQSQYSLKLDIGGKGHVILYGMPGTGKTTFIQTLLYSTAYFYSPEDVNFYILDFGGRTLGFFSELPHCLDVAFSDDEKKVEKIFNDIEEKLDERKSLFASKDVGNIQAYKNSTGEKIPAIMLVLDSYSVFRERFADFEDTLVSFAREGANYGIFLIITGSDKNAVYYRITDYAKQFITLQMTDKTSYMEILGQTYGLVPEPVKGRGLVKLNVPLEFQTALAEGELDEAQRVKKLKAKFSIMKQVWIPSCKKKIMVQEKEKEQVPDAAEIGAYADNYNMDSFYASISQDAIPLAWNKNTGMIEVMDLKDASSFYIGAFDSKEGTAMIKQIIRTIKRQRNSEIYIYEADNNFLNQFCNDNKVDAYINDGKIFDNFLENIIKEINRRILDRKGYRENGGIPENEYSYMSKYNKLFILVDGFSGFFNGISNKSLERLNKIFSIGIKNLNIYFISSENPDNLKQYTMQNLYYSMIKTGFGILLGGMLDKQKALAVQEIKIDEVKEIPEPGEGYFYKSNSYALVKVPLSD